VVGGDLPRGELCPGAPVALESWVGQRRAQGVVPCQRPNVQIRDHNACQRPGCTELACLSSDVFRGEDDGLGTWGHGASPELAAFVRKVSIGVKVTGSASKPCAKGERRQRSSSCGTARTMSGMRRKTALTVSAPICRARLRAGHW